MKRILTWVLSAALFSLCSFSVRADVPAAPSPAPSQYDLPFDGSLFLSGKDVEAIRQAMIPRPDIPVPVAGKSAVVIPPHRVISVSGVIYRSSDNWVVWINGKMIVPDDLLPEIKGIRVEKDRVHLKWFDAGLNKVISITMRPHQKYDIGTGVLLPG